MQKGACMHACIKTPCLSVAVHTAELFISEKFEGFTPLIPAAAAATAAATAAIAAKEEKQQLSSKTTNCRAAATE